MTSIPGKVVGCWLNDLSSEKNKNHNLRITGFHLGW